MPDRDERENERARAFERWCGEGSFEWRGTRAGFDAAIAAASPSSPTGPDEDEIERAARAIFRADAGWPDFMWAQVKNERKDQCRAMARAALTAARGSDSDDE